MNLIVWVLTCVLLATHHAEHYFGVLKYKNKANLRDLKAAAAVLVILLKLESNRQFCGPCDLEICWMTSKNNRAPFIYYFNLCASLQSHRWIQTGVTVRKRSIRVKIGTFLPRVTLKFDGWPWKTIGHFCYAASSFMHHFIVIIEFKLELQSRNIQFGSKSTIFLAGWPWNLTDDLEKQQATSHKYHQALFIISSPYVN